MDKDTKVFWVGAVVTTVVVVVAIALVAKSRDARKKKKTVETFEGGDFGGNVYIVGGVDGLSGTAFACLAGCTPHMSEVDTGVSLTDDGTSVVIMSTTCGHCINGVSAYAKLAARVKTPVVFVVLNTPGYTKFMKSGSPDAEKVKILLRSVQYVPCLMLSGEVSTTHSIETHLKAKALNF